MVEVGLSRRFRATHRLRLPDGTMHEDGHDYRVDVTVRGEAIPDDGMLLDLDALARAAEAAVGALDGSQLDELPAFQGVPTTVERVAEWIRRDVAAGLAGAAPGISAIRVTAFEAPDAWATVEGAFEG